MHFSFRVESKLCRLPHEVKKGVLEKLNIRRRPTRPHIQMPRAGNDDPRVNYGNAGGGGPGSGNPAAHTNNNVYFVPDSRPVNPGSTLLTPELLQAQQTTDEQLYEVGDDNAKTIRAFCSEVMRATCPSDNPQYAALREKVVEAAADTEDKVVKVEVSQLMKIKGVDPFQSMRAEDYSNPHYYCFKPHPIVDKQYVDMYGTLFKPRRKINLKDGLGLILLMDVVDGVGVNHEPSDCRHALKISVRRLPNGTQHSAHRDIKTLLGVDVLPRLVLRIEVGEVMGLVSSFKLWPEKKGWPSLYVLDENLIKRFDIDMLLSPPEEPEEPEEPEQPNMYDAPMTEQFVIENRPNAEGHEVASYYRPPSTRTQQATWMPIANFSIDGVRAAPLCPSSIHT